MPRKQTIEPTESALQEILTGHSEEERQRIRQALMDSATGVRTRVRVRKVGVGAKGEQEYHLTATGGEEWWVYERAPDMAALQMLFQYNLGKPATRSNERMDPVLNVIHHIPGKPDVHGVPTAREDDQETAPDAVLDRQDVFDEIGV